MLNFAFTSEVWLNILFQALAAGFIGPAFAMLFTVPTRFLALIGLGSALTRGDLLWPEAARPAPDLYCALHHLLNPRSTRLSCALSLDAGHRQQRRRPIDHLHPRAVPPGHALLGYHQRHCRRHCHPAALLLQVPPHQALTATKQQQDSSPNRPPSCCNFWQSNVKLTKTKVCAFGCPHFIKLHRGHTAPFSF